MSVGTSVTELIQAIAKCKDIYDAFRSEYESAPSRIKELVDTCEYLRNILEDFQSILGDVYPQGISFGRKLDECNAFINRYKSLKQDYLQVNNVERIPSRLRSAWDRAWQTGQFAFDGTRARDLKDALSLEIQKLVLFILVFALRRTVPVNPSTSLAQRVPPVVRPHIHETNTFEDIFARLQSVRYIYEREMSIAVQQNRAPNLISLHDELGSGWHALCVRAGLIHQNDQAPPLSANRLLVAPSQNMNDLLVNLGAPSIHSAFPSWSSVPPQQPSTTTSPSIPGTLQLSPSVQSEAPSTFDSPLIPTTSQPWYSSYPRHSETQNGASSLHLSDPLMPSYIATINLPHQQYNRVMRLRHWTSHQIGDIRKIVWIGENSAETLEHHLTPNVFPDTLHSSQNFQLHVSFPEPHYIEWQFGDGVQCHQHILVEYDFLEPGPRKEFQGAVRDKYLVETFDFNVLYSKRVSSGKEGESILQDLKIWQDRNPPKHHSLSFLATTEKNEHLEFSFLWFQAPIKQESKSSTVTLEFVQRKESGSASSTLRRRSTLQRVVLSWARSHSPPRDTLPPIVEPPVSPEISAHLPPADIANEFKSFTIKFTTTQEAESFVNIFNNAHKEDSVLLSEASYNFRSSSGLGLAESPTLGPLQSSSDVFPDEASTSSPLDFLSGHSPTSYLSTATSSATLPSSAGSPFSSFSHNSTAQKSTARSSVSSSTSPQLPQFPFEQSSPENTYFS